MYHLTYVYTDGGIKYHYVCPNRSSFNHLATRGCKITRIQVYENQRYRDASQAEVNKFYEF